MSDITALQPNSTQIPNFLVDEVMGKVSSVAFNILILIARQTYGWVTDPSTGRRKERDWLAYSQLCQKTGKKNEAIHNALFELEELNLIQVTDSEGQAIPLKMRNGKRLFYSIQTFPKIEEVDTNLSENRNSKIGKTKLIHTKTVTKVTARVYPKRVTTCPLLTISTLKEKYPNGHTECVQYVNSFKFMNLGKQFMYLHKMLRAGLDFPDIDKIINQMEKKFYYKENGYDMASVAGEAERKLNALTN